MLPRHLRKLGHLWAFSVVGHAHMLPGGNIRLNRRDLGRPTLKT
jgi:hypothetical protein